MTWVEVHGVLFKTQEMSVLDVAKRRSAQSEISKAAAQGVRDQRAGSAKSEIPQVRDQQAGSAKSEIPKVAAAEVRDPQADSGSQHNRPLNQAPQNFTKKPFFQRTRILMQILMQRTIFGIALTMMTMVGKGMLLGRDEVS